MFASEMLSATFTVTEQLTGPEQQQLN